MKDSLRADLAELKGGGINRRSVPVGASNTKTLTKDDLEPEQGLCKCYNSFAFIPQCFFTSSGRYFCVLDH